MAREGQERTAEEREAARLERARRRALREGRDPDAIAPALPPLEEPPAEAHEPPLEPHHPPPAEWDPADDHPYDAAAEPAPAEGLDPAPAEHFELLHEPPPPPAAEHPGGIATGHVSDPVQPAPAENFELLDPPPAVEQQAAPEHPPATGQTPWHEGPVDPATAAGPAAAAAPAPEPEPPLPASGPIDGQAPAADPSGASLPADAHDLAGPIPVEADHGEERAAALPAAVAAEAAASADGTQDDGRREAPAASTLPPPPPAPGAGRTPPRSARRGERLPPPPPVGAGGHHRRSWGKRLGALLALVVVAVAVVLVVHSLKGSSSPKAASTPKVVKVLIPEGMTRLQIDQIAAKAGLTGSYRAASRSSPLLDPRSYGAPATTRTLEGFLFPATYDEYPGGPASKLVADQLTAFGENVGPALQARARALHLSVYQLLIVASMVEREAKVPGDRAKVAAVIYNRLHREMPLGVDATIYYAIEAQRDIPTYTKELTEADLHMNSAYNTRTHVGLPPTPISNPGLAAIEAAAHPAPVSYLYYVNGADGCGEMVFSNTAAEFEANAAAYKEAVSRNGGKPPVCKKK